jgi:cell division septation protein DedD
MDQVWRSARWAKLARGFASQGALLILFAPAGALAALELELDGVVVLSPRGFNTETGALPGLSRRIASGTPVLGTVVDEPSTRPTPVPSPPVRSSRPSMRRPLVTQPRPGTPWKRILAVVGVLALAVVAVALWARGAGSAEPSQPLPPAAAAAAPAPGDSLFYSVQVAAFDALPTAMAHAATLQQAGTPAIVTPEHRRGRDAWYRVLVGALPTSRAADSLRRHLWDRGVLEAPQGTIMRVPEAYRLADAQPYDDAESSARALRARGVPAYIVGAPNGLARVYVGAFDLPDQARALDSLLAATGIRGTLASRMGITR